MNSISDIYLFCSLSFSVCYVFKSRIYNVHLLSVYSFFFYSPVEGLCCKPKYRANIIHHFIFILFIYFFYHSDSSCRKDQLIYCFKFQIWYSRFYWSSLVCRCGFAFTSVSCHNSIIYFVWFFWYSSLLWGLRDNGVTKSHVRILIYRTWANSDKYYVIQNGASRMSAILDVIYIVD